MPRKPRADIQEFGATFKQFMDDAVAAAPRNEPVFLRRLTEHFGSDPRQLPVVSPPGTGKTLTAM